MIEVMHEDNATIEIWNGGDVGAYRLGVGKGHLHQMGVYERLT
jgi:hypothetical protein